MIKVDDFISRASYQQGLDDCDHRNAQERSNINKSASKHSWNWGCRTQMPSAHP